MKAEAIVIQRPQRQGHGRRALFALLTLFAWMIWASLWLPLITLLAWAFGVRESYVALVVREHGDGMGDLILIASIALTCSLLAILWSGYNYGRFHNKNRRQERPTVGTAAMAAALKVRPPTAASMRAARRIVLQFADDGSVSHQAGDEPGAESLTHEALPPSA